MMQLFPPKEVIYLFVLIGWFVGLSVNKVTQNVVSHFYET